MRKGILALLFLATCSLLVAQQAMNNDSVIKLVKAGLSDDLIVTTINASPGRLRHLRGRDHRPEDRWRQRQGHRGHRCQSRCTIHAGSSARACCCTSVEDSCRC